MAKKVIKATTEVNWEDFKSDRHVAHTILKQYKDKTKRELGDLSKVDLIVSGNLSPKPIDVSIYGEKCWIKEGELALIKEAGINLEDIKLMWYLPGLLGPFSPEKNIWGASTSDGYQVVIAYTHPQA